MPINFSDERRIIESYFLDNFDSSVTPVQFDNVAKLINGNTMVEQDDVSEWVRLSILNFDNQPTALGNKCKIDRIYGQLICSVFIRENAGSNRAREIADTIYPILHRKSIEEITTRNTVVTQIPPADGWYMCVLTTEYFWDKCQ